MTQSFFNGLSEKVSAVINRYNVITRSTDYFAFSNYLKYFYLYPDNNILSIVKKVQKKKKNEIKIRKILYTSKII